MVIPVGERIRAERVTRQMTQEDLGDLLGVTDTAVRSIETGRNRSPDLTARLCVALGLVPPFECCPECGRPGVA